MPSIEPFPDDYDPPDAPHGDPVLRARATPAGEDLVAQVREAFTEGGVLSRAAEQFRERDGQTQMALAVAETIDAGGVLVVEAGTGVGKTFSYLVPALLSGERVLLSTATKALQDQLFGRDLPRLVEALNLPVRTALLKGRGSYLCLHRLGLARHDASLPERGSLRTLAKIEQWATATRTGDLAELPGLDERSPLIPLFTSTRENCLGAQCPQFKSCHVNLARREALAADVVVINHHLFFADLAVRESGMAELLPSVRVVVFDEAHQLNEIGVQFLGTQLGTGQALDFARDVMASGLQHARGLVDWNQLDSTGGSGFDVSTGTSWLRRSNAVRASCEWPPESSIPVRSCAGMPSATPRRRRASTSASGANRSICSSRPSSWQPRGSTPSARFRRISCGCTSAL